MELEWHVGDVVRKLRETRRPRWTQTQLAKHADLNKATVVRIEENAPGIKRETYESISRAFHLSVADLWALVPTRAPAPSARDARENSTRDAARTLIERRAAEIVMEELEERHRTRDRKDTGTRKLRR